MLLRSFPALLDLLIHGDDVAQVPDDDVRIGEHVDPRKSSLLVKPEVLADRLASEESIARVRLLDEREEALSLGRRVQAQLRERGSATHGPAEARPGVLLRGVVGPPGLVLRDRVLVQLLEHARLDEHRRAACPADLAQPAVLDALQRRTALGGTVAQDVALASALRARDLEHATERLADDLPVCRDLDLAPLDELSALALRARLLNVRHGQEVEHANLVRRLALVRDSRDDVLLVRQKTLEQVRLERHVVVQVQDVVGTKLDGVAREQLTSPVRVLAGRVQVLELEGLTVARHALHPELHERLHERVGHEVVPGQYPDGHGRHDLALVPNELGTPLLGHGAHGTRVVRVDRVGRLEGACDGLRSRVQHVGVAHLDVVAGALMLLGSWETVGAYGALPERPQAVVNVLAAEPRERVGIEGSQRLPGRAPRRDGQEHEPLGREDAVQARHALEPAGAVALGPSQRTLRVREVLHERLVPARRHDRVVVQDHDERAGLRVLAGLHACVDGLGEGLVAHEAHHVDVTRVGRPRRARKREDVEQGLGLDVIARVVHDEHAQLVLRVFLERQQTQLGPVSVSVNRDDDVDHSSTFLPATQSV